MKVRSPAAGGGGASSRTADIEAESPPYLTLTRGRALKAFDWSAAAAIAVSIVYGVLVYPVGLTWGLIAVAVGGGWVIGAAARRGAWKDSPHDVSRRLQLLAALFGIVAWFGGVLVAYILSQVLLPGSEFSLPERFARTPPGDYVAGLYQANGFVHSTALAAMAIMGWRTAR